MEERIKRIKLKEGIKRILCSTVLPNILLYIVFIAIILVIARSYNVDVMKHTTILFFLIAYFLIFYDVIISEIGIFRFKIKENNFLMRKRGLRYFLNIFKIILPINVFLRFYTTKWQLIFFTSIIWIVFYSFIGIKNTLSVYLHFREKDFKKRVKYICPNPMRRFVIKNDQIIEYIN